MSIITVDLPHLVSRIPQTRVKALETTKQMHERTFRVVSDALVDDEKWKTLSRKFHS
jgi:hypothetical protein